ncbi:class I SAM-dependent methyltransferase [Terrimonas alba]|uniref:class I SAM-dependent methyltransferase n=1 Tax=Terrimonas alba TaxID=3349636 RepID=UPI0035F3D502
MNMLTNVSLQTFSIRSDWLKVYVPDIDHVKDVHGKKKQSAPGAPFPYWAQIWPAALGLCDFLADHLPYIQDKKIVELGAGLALPSLFASRYAKEVVASDFNPDAVTLMQRSAIRNGIKNINCRLLDWNHLPPSLTADTLLMSDVNYDPVAFETLYAVLKQFLATKAVIILSTPQRLMAKPFIERLLPHCIVSETKMIDTANGPVAISIQVLQQS